MILVIAGALAVAMIVLIEAGQRAGVRHLAKLPDEATTSNAVVDAAIFGLMGLLLAFTFSGAASRWEWRRSLVVQEANNIGTAYLRLDLLPSEHQPKLRGNIPAVCRSQACDLPEAARYQGSPRRVRTLRCHTGPALA